MCPGSAAETTGMPGHSCTAMELSQDTLPDTGSEPIAGAGTTPATGCCSSKAGYGCACSGSCGSGCGGAAGDGVPCDCGSPACACGILPVKLQLKDTFLQLKVARGCRAGCARRRSLSASCPRLPSLVDDAERDCRCRSRGEPQPRALNDLAFRPGCAQGPQSTAASSRSVSDNPGLAPPPGTFVVSDPRAALPIPTFPIVALPDAFVPAYGRTTLVLKNLPESCDRGDVMALLDELGFARRYDFLYVPINLGTRLSYRYAFVNFIDCEAASAALRALSGFQDWPKEEQRGSPICVLWSGIQGLQAYIEKYRSSAVMHEDVPENCRPALFRQGQLLTFPEPTKRIRAPRNRDQVRLSVGGARYVERRG